MPSNMWARVATSIWKGLVGIETASKDTRMQKAEHEKLECKIAH